MFDSQWKVNKIDKYWELPQIILLTIVDFLNTTWHTGAYSFFAADDKERSMHILGVEEA